jgi:drug/metabolite transporter (DMT)-like permease
MKMDASYSIAFLIALIAGAAVITQKWLLNQGINYRAMLVVNVGFFILFGSIYAWYHRNEVVPIIRSFTPRIFMILGLQILFTTFLISILNYELLLRNDSYIAVGLTLSAPIFTVILAKTLLHEEINPKGLLGIAVMLVGTWLIIQAKKESG